MSKKTRRTPEQIVDLLREIERDTTQGKSIAQACKDRSIGEWTYYRWRKQYAGMNRQDAKRLKDLEKENARLKKLLAERDLDLDMLKEVLEGKF